MNSKPEIEAKIDEDEDDFPVLYSRLVNVFRREIPFTIVLPLAIRLLKVIPPEKLDVYKSLSQWSCYKNGVDITGNWFLEGMDLLQEATEEQYRVKKAEETATELTRREKTVFRQEVADTVIRQCRWEVLEIKEEKDIGMLMEIAKEEAIREEAVRFKETQERRAKADSEEKERLLSAKKAYRNEHFIVTDDGFTYWSIIIGGTALIGAVIAVMKGYHYI